MANAEVVQTRAGAVRGFEDERDTWCWPGIPFARPPIGPLRWKAPRDPEPWEGVRDATAFSEPCIQRYFIQGTIVGSGGPGTLAAGRAPSRSPRPTP
jgi:para-nitrobenzyl esterase